MRNTPDGHRPGAGCGRFVALVHRGNRLSVMPVSGEEWEHIHSLE